MVDLNYVQFLDKEGKMNIIVAIFAFIVIFGGAVLLYWIVSKIPDPEMEEPDRYF